MSEGQFFSGAERRQFRPHPKYKDSGVEWLGRIPLNWKIYPFKRLFKTIYRYPTYFGIEYANDGIKEVRGEALGGDGQIIELEDQRYIPLELSEKFQRTILEEGDLVMSVRGTMGKIAYVDPRFACANITANLLRLSPRRDLAYGQYLVKVISSTYFDQQLDRQAPQTTIKTITMPQLAVIPIALPPKTDQLEIASFLDRKTSKIDALIEKKERLIELLQEKRTALVTQAVTKGLDPNVPMKDSGVEWLGEIPAHWEVMRLKYLSSINDETLSEKTDPRFELIYIDIGSVDQFHGIVECEELIYETAPSRARRVVRDGDVIISTVRTYLRAIALINNPESNLIVSTGFAVIRPSSALNSIFAAYVLRASYFVEKVVANSVGVSYPAIDTHKMSSFPIAVPDIQEQQAIALFLDRETAKIDDLVAKIRDAIDRLKEYRTAIISAAVTGKIDVRDTWSTP